MTRVVVIGNAGGGKSTVSKAICERHGLPYVELDRLLWKPDWVPVPATEFDAAHRAAIDAPRWLIDGFGPWDSLQSRIDAADTIVFIDHPVRIHFWWATKRQFRSILLGRKDGPEGCPMLPVTIRLYRMIWWLHREMRPKLMALLNACQAEKRIIHIRSPQDLKAFARNPV